MRAHVWTTFPIEYDQSVPKTALFIDVNSNGEKGEMERIR